MGWLYSECHASNPFEVPVYVLGDQDIRAGKAWLCFASYPSGYSDALCINTVTRGSSAFHAIKGCPGDFSGVFWHDLKEVGAWYHPKYGWGFYAHRVDGSLAPLRKVVREIPAEISKLISEPKPEIVIRARESGDAYQPEPVEIEPYVIGEDMEDFK
jgi:hypothetical protein